MLFSKSTLSSWRRRFPLVLLSISFTIAIQARDDTTNSTTSIDISTPHHDNKEQRQQSLLTRQQVLQSDSRAFVYSVDYDPRGEQLAAASLGLIFLWNTTTTTTATATTAAAGTSWELEGWVSLPHFRAVREVRYAPIGGGGGGSGSNSRAAAATAGDDGTVRIWSTASVPWSEVTVLTLPRLPSVNANANASASLILPQPRSLAWHPTGAYLAVAGYGLATAVYDATTWRPLPLPFETVAHMAVLLHGNNGRNNDNTGDDDAMEDPLLLAHHVDWSPDGQLLMVDSKAYDFDLATLQITPSTAMSDLSFANSNDNGDVPPIPSTSFTRPQWKPDGTRVAAASAGVVGVASVHNPTTAAEGAVHLPTSPSYVAVASLQWSPERNRDDGPSYLLVGGAGQPHVHLWPVPPDDDGDGNRREEWTGAVTVPTSQAVGARAVRWHPSGGKRQFAVANAGVVDVWQFSGDENGGRTPAPTPLEMENIIEATGDNVDGEYQSTTYTMHWATLLGGVLLVLFSFLALVGVMRLRWRWVVVPHNGGTPNAESSSSSNSSDKDDCDVADSPSSHIGDIISIVACKSSSGGQKASFDTSTTEQTEGSTSTPTQHCDVEHGLKKFSNEEKEDDVRLDDDDDDSEEAVDDYDDFDWKELPRKVQRAAEILGYNERLWDKGKSPPSEDKSWRRLSKAEQKAARVLGYDKEKWDAD